MPSATADDGRKTCHFIKMCVISYCSVSLLSTSVVLRFTYVHLCTNHHHAVSLAKPFQYSSWIPETIAISFLKALGIWVSVDLFVSWSLHNLWIYCVERAFPCVPNPQPVLLCSLFGNNPCATRHINNIQQRKQNRSTRKRTSTTHTKLLLRRRKIDR